MRSRARRCEPRDSCLTYLGRLSFAFLLLLAVAISGGIYLYRLSFHDKAQSIEWRLSSEEWTMFANTYFHWGRAYDLQAGQAYSWDRACDDGFWNVLKALGPIGGEAVHAPEAQDVRYVLQYVPRDVVRTIPIAVQDGVLVFRFRGRWYYGGKWDYFAECLRTGVASTIADVGSTAHELEMWWTDPK